jgi:hypothetical protein
MTTDERIARVLATGRARVSRATFGEHVNPSVVVDAGGMEYHFDLGRDGRWRHGSTTGWSGWSGAVCDAPRVGLNRPCCDASGHRVDRDSSQVLHRLVAAAIDAGRQ